MDLLPSKPRRDRLFRRTPSDPSAIFGHGPSLVMSGQKSEVESDRHSGFVHCDGECGVEGVDILP